MMQFGLTNVPPVTHYDLRRVQVKSGSVILHYMIRVCNRNLVRICSYTD